MPAPNSSMIHSGRFCAQTAMRSPFLKRVEQRAGGALRLAVQLGIGPLPPQRRVGTPAIRASRSGADSAALRRRSPKVHSRTAGVVGPATWDIVKAIFVLPGPLLVVRRRLREAKCLWSGGNASGCGVQPSLRGAKPRSNPVCCGKGSWIASRSLSSGARSRDPLARNDGERGYPARRCRADERCAFRAGRRCAVVRLAVDYGDFLRRRPCRPSGSASAHPSG